MSFQEGQLVSVPNDDRAAVVVETYDDRVVVELSNGCETDYEIAQVNSYEEPKPIADIDSEHKILLGQIWDSVDERIQQYVCLRHQIDPTVAAFSVLTWEELTGLHKFYYMVVYTETTEDFWVERFKAGKISSANLYAFAKMAERLDDTLRDLKMIS